MSDSEQYRRELELELERLTRELADVRVEKAQQRQRIENLQLEQNQLKDQMLQHSGSAPGNKTGTSAMMGDKELRTDLAQQLQTLHQVVKQKKQEHSQVKREWERSQEQYAHLKQTVGLLKGSTALRNSLNVDDDDDDDDDDDESLKDDLDGSAIPLLSNKKKNSDNNDSSVVGPLANSLAKLSKLDGARPTNGGGRSAGHQQIEDFTWETQTVDSSIAFNDDDNGTVITSMTKDSLQVHRRNGRANDGGDDDNGTVVTEMTKDSLQMARVKRSGRKPETLTVAADDFDDNGTVITDFTKDSVQLARSRRSRRSDYEDELAGGASGDNGTVVTEATKDSLQILREQQSRSKSGSNGDGGLSKFFTKEAARSRSPKSGSGSQDGKGASGDGSASGGNKKSLGAFFEKERKKPADTEKDLKSASE